tara:strand:- start:474 stop:776 length:303 start_codon:yes stop_codon:yes gene_type:complete
MILYSVTIIITDSITEKWELWMKREHIPDVMATGLFKSYNFLKDLNLHNKYIIQYELESIQDYLKYKKRFALKLQTQHSEKFSNNYTACRIIWTKNKKFN